MSEVITLSSDEEEVAPLPNKRIKLTTLTESKPPAGTSCIVLSDEDDDLEVKGNAQDSKAEGEAAPDSVAGEEVLEIQPTKVEQIDGALGIGDCVNGQTSSSNSDLRGNTDTVTTNGDLGVDSIDSDEAFKKKLFDFLDKCIDTVRKLEHREQMSSKLPTMRLYYKKLVHRSQNFASLLELIESNQERLNSFPEKGVIAFTDVFKWLKMKWKDLENDQIASGQNQRIIRRLEKTLYKLHCKIKQLEEAEVDFDDEENSHYLQCSRYKQRSGKVYRKLCQYKKEDPNFGSLLNCRLDFSASKYREINLAINRKYKNNKVFPTFFDLDRYIRQCVESKGLSISEDSLKFEIKHCFEELGNLLQRRRKLELLDLHKDFIGNTADPALTDPAINCKLLAHYSDAKKKTNEIMSKYVRLQDTGVNPEISSDSEDSNVADSDGEEAVKQD